MDFKDIKNYMLKYYNGSKIEDQLKNLGHINQLITFDNKIFTLYDLALESAFIENTITEQIRALGGKSFKEIQRIKIQRIKSAYEKIKKKWLNNKKTNSIIFDYIVYYEDKNKTNETFEDFKIIMNYETISRQFYDVINEQRIINIEENDILFAGSVFEYAIRVGDNNIVKYLFDNVSKEQKYKLLSKIENGIVNGTDYSKQLHESISKTLGTTAFQKAVLYDEYDLVTCFLDKVNLNQGYKLIEQKSSIVKNDQKICINAIHIFTYNKKLDKNILKRLIKGLEGYKNKSYVINAIDHELKTPLDRLYDNVDLNPEKCITILRENGGIDFWHTDYDADISVKTAKILIRAYDNLYDKEFILLAQKLKNQDANNNQKLLQTVLRQDTKKNKRKLLQSLIGIFNLKQIPEQVSNFLIQPPPQQPPPPPTKKRAEWSNVCIKF